LAEKKCVDYEVKAVRPRGRPKKIWSDIVVKKQSDLTTTQGRCYGL